MKVENTPPSLYLVYDRIGVILNERNKIFLDYLIFKANQHRQNLKQKNHLEPSNEIKRLQMKIFDMQSKYELLKSSYDTAQKKLKEQKIDLESVELSKVKFKETITTLQNKNSRHVSELEMKMENLESEKSELFKKQKKLLMQIEGLKNKELLYKEEISNLNEEKQNDSKNVGADNEV